MVQGGQHLRFSPETRYAVGVVGERVGQDLQRDIATEPRVACAVDLAHPTDAEEGQNLVCAESGAGLKGHGIRGVRDYTGCGAP